MITAFRNLAFVTLVCIGTFAFETKVFAAMGDALENVCDNWDNGVGFNCTHCSTGGGFPPEWTAEGSCDFSEIESQEEREQTAAAYCMEHMGGFDQTCETEFDNHLATWFEFNMSTSDPCYQAAKTPGCWFTWANASCDAGAQSSWNGNCEAFLTCECDTQ